MEKCIFAGQRRSDNVLQFKFTQDKEGPIGESLLSEVTSLFLLPLRFLTYKNNDKVQNVIWKDVPGFEGLYKISNTGILVSMHHKTMGRVLKPWQNKRGYHTVVLRKNCSFKNFKLHRIVAMAFIPNPENKEQVNHVDGNKLNNSVSNLEWVTNLENMRHSYKNGFHKNSHYNFKRIKNIAQ